jgi:glycosyltransferase involved in cell wall biosynthesis
VKVGILARDFIQWTGGVDFLGMVLDSLLAVPRAEQAEFHLLIPDLQPRWARVKHRARQGLRGLVSGKPAAPKSASPEGAGSDLFSEFRGRVTIHHLENTRRALVREVRELELDVILPALHTLGAGFLPPWVGYVYDFQHKYFPEYFTPRDCLSRDEHFADLLTSARAVIATSRETAGDIAKFVPEATARVFALPFAPALNPEWMEDCPDIPARHGVARPFFLVSNQFWIHKDHATAFEAFRALAARHPEVSLICTGSTRDERDPTYFPRLMDKLKSWGLDQRVRVLGLIPKRDQIEIMKNACAVLQPTRFEGGPGGGSIYNAVSLDVPAIVSDLPVNREVEGGAVEFFPAGDAGALCEKMEKRLAAPHVRASWDSLINRGQSRRAACGAVIWQAIDFVA